MPKQTFYNLPKEKRSYIEKCAMKEFATHAYDKVSISKIVEAAGIAKGSFYQYFEGKIDLAGHLLTQIANEEVVFVEAHKELNEREDFFDWLRFQIELSIQFAINNMDYIRAYKCFMAVDIPELNEVLARLTDTMGVNFYVKKIKLGIENGKLRDDLSAEFLGQYVMMVVFSLLDDYFRKGAADPDALGDELLRAVNQSIDVIEYGIRKVGGD
jgi:AcrR family transcriptional regulator